MNVTTDNKVVIFWLSAKVVVFADYTEHAFLHAHTAVHADNKNLAKYDYFDYGKNLKTPN